VSADWSASPAPVPYANFGDPQSLNLYGFVGGNPVSKADPDGHECPACPEVAAEPGMEVGLKDLVETGAAEGAEMIAGVATATGGTALRMVIGAGGLVVGSSTPLNNSPAERKFLAELIAQRNLRHIPEKKKGSNES
jgi:hypothetical protein